MAPRPLKPYPSSISVTELDDVAHPCLQRFTYGDLQVFTDNFDDQNFIARTQYCYVYRGRIPQGWIYGMEDNEEEEEQIVRFGLTHLMFPELLGIVKTLIVLILLVNAFSLRQDEIALLSNPVVCSHPNVVKLMGWCCDIENENVGVVYDLDSFDTLRNLIPGEILKWPDRIKITFGLVSLLKVLHNHRPQYMVLNISSAHIMIDQDGNPVLLDFGMLITEVPSPKQTIFFPLGVYNYCDPLIGLTMTELDDVAHPCLQRFTYGDLQVFTDNFNDQNFIARTQYCYVYRGRIPQGWINGIEDNEEEEQIVTVKIWADSVDVPRNPRDHEDFNRVNFDCKFIQIKGEIALLSNPVVCNHPNLVKLMGWCCEIENENVGVVYDLDSYDTLRNLIPGEILKWTDRIQITFGLASLLKVLHNHQPPYMVLNISSAHIMIDQDRNPVLLDFGMLVTEVPSLKNPIFFPLGVYTYWDPLMGLIGITEATDVFAFGVLLMELLCKSTTDSGVDFYANRRCFLHFRAEDLYHSFIKANGLVPSGTLVEKSLMGDVGFDYHDETLLSMIAVHACSTRINAQAWYESLLF